MEVCPILPKLLTTTFLFSKETSYTLIKYFVHASTDSSYLKYFFPKFIKSRLYHFCYTTCGQKISICNYWNGKQKCHFRATVCSLFCISFDLQHIIMPLCLFFSVDPHQRERYLKSSNYLAPLNGEIEHANSTGSLRLHGFW